MVLRPSGAWQWRKCAAYASLVMADDDVPEDDTEIREEGIACHWAAATGAQEGATAPNGVAVDSDMVDAVTVYRNALAAWGVPVVQEQEAHCFGIHHLLKGTPDADGWCPTTRTLYIADLKYGFRYVDHVMNPQLLCYADGVARRYGLQSIMDCNRVVFLIVQPRHYSSEMVRTWSATPSELLPEMENLRAAAHRAFAPNPVGTINEGCHRSSCRMQCATYRAAALDAASLYMSYGATPERLPFEFQELELRHMNMAADILHGYKTGLEQQVQHAIKNGARSRFFEMRQEMTPLQWDQDAIPKMRAMAEIMGVNIDKEQQTITPTQAKKQLGEQVVNMYARRHPKPLKLRPTDVKVWRRIFGNKTQ